LHRFFSTVVVNYKSTIKAFELRIAQFRKKTNLKMQFSQNHNFGHTTVQQVSGEFVDQFGFT